MPIHLYVYRGELRTLKQSGNYLNAFFSEYGSSWADRLAVESTSFMLFVGANGWFAITEGTTGVTANNTSHMTA
jgi:hypothetical protein